MGIERESNEKKVVQPLKTPGLEGVKGCHQHD